MAFLISSSGESSLEAATQTVTRLKNQTVRENLGMVQYRLWNCIYTYRIYPKATHTYSVLDGRVFKYKDKSWNILLRTILPYR